MTAQDERAAIVAFLRKAADQIDNDPRNIYNHEAAGAVDAVADCIEAGIHIMAASK